jgi:pimeloyl-ACP methyl ester carboxylesterase
MTSSTFDMHSPHMRHLLACVFIGIGLFAVAAAHAAAANAADAVFRQGFEPYAGVGPTQTCTYTPDGNGFFTLTSAASNYTVRLPPGYDTQNPQPRQLLVAIHGCGDSAMNFATWAAVPFALRASQDYIAISVGGRDGQCWSVGTDDALVSAAIAHASSCFYVHEHKIVLAGYSSGGGLAYHLAMTDARRYAGVLIENSSLSSVVGASHVDAALDAVWWPLNIAHSARISDENYPIAAVQADWSKMLAHDFPLQTRAIAGMHGDTSDDWQAFLLPKMANWVSP